MMVKSREDGPMFELPNFERRKRQVQPCMVEVMSVIDGNEVVKALNVFVRVWMRVASSPMANASGSWVDDVFRFGRMVWTTWLEL
jgi:hypothetical protein